MPDPSETSSLTLSGLHHRCSEESERFFKRQAHDPRFCFELFRRAVLYRDQQAWELVYAQYQPLVAGWVERHSLFPALDEETQYYVNWAFEKMWSVLTPQKFEQFPDLKSILRYLQMCVHSILVDSMRSREQASLLEDAVPEGEAELAAPGEELEVSVEETVMTRAYAREVWQWLDERLKNEKERRVIYGSFVLAFKPAEIYAEFPGAFRDVKEVYLIKENVLARLRRDGQLKELLVG